MNTINPGNSLETAYDLGTFSYSLEEPLGELIQFSYENTYDSEDISQYFKTRKAIS